MIASRRNRVFERVFSLYTTRLLRRHFHGIHAAGLEFAGNRDAVHPLLVYANHSNWWDGLVMFHISRRLWRRDAHLMMDVRQMRRYSFFRSIGVFSVDRASPRSAYRSLQHGADLLRDSGKVLWLFPQGVLQANDLRPVVFESGIARLAALLPGCTLLCLAMRYEYFNEQRPEVFLRFGDPERAGASPEAPRDMARRLAAILERRLDTLRDDVIARRLDGFQTVLRGRASRNDILDRVHELRGRA